MDGLKTAKVLAQFKARKGDISFSAIESPNKVFRLQMGGAWMRTRQVTLPRREAGFVPPGAMFRVYKAGVVNLHTSPMLSNIKHGATILVETYMVEPPRTYCANILEVEDGIEGLPFLHMSYIPLNAVQYVYPDINPVLPPEGLLLEHSWLGLTQSPDLDYNEIARIQRRLIDEARRDPEALRKAEELLTRMAAQWGFIVTPTEVRKGELSISRSNAAVHLAGAFRCVTSSIETPLDDQVLQKLMGMMAVPERISTLSAHDIARLRRVFSLDQMEAERSFGETTR